MIITKTYNIDIPNSFIFRPNDEITRALEDLFGIPFSYFGSKVIEYKKSNNNDSSFITSQNLL